MRITLMCPKCGDIMFPCTANDSDYICDYCGTKRIDVGQAVKDSEINYDSDRDLLEQRIYRKYLYTNPQFDEEIFERRINHAKAFREEIRQTVEADKYARNNPSCPKCGSTQIQMVQRKWSLLTGFLTNKVDRVCVNCKCRF